MTYDKKTSWHNYLLLCSCPAVFLLQFFHLFRHLAIGFKSILYKKKIYILQQTDGETYSEMVRFCVLALMSGDRHITTIIRNILLKSIPSFLPALLEHIHNLLSFSPVQPVWSAAPPAVVEAGLSHCDKHVKDTSVLKPVTCNINGRTHDLWAFIVQRQLCFDR